MFIEKQSPGLFRQYPTDLSQQGDVFGGRDMVKYASGEGNIEDTRFYRKAHSFE
jgi:hypothetical protein